MRKIIVIVLALLLALTLLGGCGRVCKFPGCDKKAIKGSDYCETHDFIMGVGDAVKDGIKDIFG
jgi:hypothetical protein